MKLNLRNDTIGFGTNVLDIEVPDQLRNKIKSGLEFVDGALGGEGFTPSQVLLFTGTPGVYVPVKDTVKGFAEILDGKHDSVPESNFYMKGGIDSVEK